MGKKRKGASKWSIFYVVVILACVGYLVWSIASPNGQTTISTTDGSQETIPTIATSTFVSAVKEGQVASVTYTPDTMSLRGKYWANVSDIGDESKLADFKSTYAGDDSLDTLMAEYPSVSYTVDASTDSSMVETLLVTVLPTVLLIAVMIYFMSRLQGQNNGAMNFGKTKAQTTAETRPKVKFEDVAGIDEAVEELKEVRDFLAQPEKFARMGAKIPHGVLLMGPPGTGKTLLAKAVAGEAGVPFFSISGSDFVEMFVGVGASRVRDLFKQAKAAAPAIVFIDEIDAVGRQRGAGLGGGHDEREQTLNQLLVEMDGFEQKETVILIAATNRPDVLDPALLRPGRFDRQITVDKPDVRGREKILQVHSENKPLADDVKFDKLAQLTPGFAGADLANLMNEAAILAARNGSDKITMNEIEESMERVIAGPERKSRVMSDEERHIIAYHESGHAIIGHLLDNADPVHKISIIARGQALGYTLSLPDEDRYLQSRNAMLDQITVLLGGRTAEEVFCKDITTGASNDLERATKIARQMVTRYGMSKVLGAQVFGEAQHEVFLGRDYADKQDYSPETALRIDGEVSRIMRAAHERAREILEANADQMHLMAQILLARETVEGDACQALLDNRWFDYVEEHPEYAVDVDELVREEAAPVEGSDPELQDASAPNAGRHVRKVDFGDLPDF